MPDVENNELSEPDSNRIKSIWENVTFGVVAKDRVKEGMRGASRVEGLAVALPEEDQRRIGELHIVFMDRLTLDAPSKLGAIFGKKPIRIRPWRAIDIELEENGGTTVQIDPWRLPVDDSEITQYLITVAKKCENQRKAEAAVEDLRREVQLSLAYDDDGRPDFFKSLPEINKIKNAIKTLDEDETGMLSRSDLLILMIGQNKEYYRGSKYRIILSCDSLMSEDEIASCLRRELRRVEQEDAVGGAPNRKPTKKSVLGIFSKTHGKIAGVLAAFAVAGGGAAVVKYINKKPIPVDATHALKAPEKGLAESGEIKKIDLSKIPVGGKVSFKTLEDGVKMGVLVKDGPDYVAVDKFEFVKDGSNAVERLRK